jgi:hypothetical protein
MLTGEQAKVNEDKAIGHICGLTRSPLWFINAKEAEGFQKVTGDLYWTHTPPPVGWICDLKSGLGMELAG